MREDDDRSRVRISRDVALEPFDLLGADRGFTGRDIVERDEMNAAMIECVMRLSEELPIENAVVQRRVMLTGDIHHLLRLQPRCQRLKELHPFGVLAGHFRLVRKVAGEERSEE